MTGPVEFRRDRNVAKLLSDPSDWNGLDSLEKMFAPANVSSAFEPDDKVKRLLGALWATEYRVVLEWIYDLTIDAPYPHIGATRDAAALAAKAHEARAAVGRVIFKAIAQGNELINAKEPPPP